MARYVVTGADGFIASHLCRMLRENGNKVVAFARYHGSQKLERLKPEDYSELVWGDCTCEDTLDHVNGPIDGVFHLAAAIDVAWSLTLGRAQGGGYYWMQNVFGTQQVIRFCARKNTRMLLMSSSEVYGTPEITPIRESDSLHPQSPYAKSKVEAELACILSAHSGGDCVRVRPFNTYGPGQSQRSVIAKICQHAANGKGVLKLGNVNTKRDWVYVEDTCLGLMLAMDLGRRGEVYNLGTGRSVTVAEAARIAGIEIEPGHGQDRGSAEVLVL